LTLKESEEKIYDIVKSLRFPPTGKRKKWATIGSKLGEMQKDKLIDYHLDLSKKSATEIQTIFTRMSKRIDDVEISVDALGKITQMLIDEHLPRKALGNIIFRLTGMTKL